jgi:hypothetical protein
MDNWGDDRGDDPRLNKLRRFLAVLYSILLLAAAIGIGYGIGYLIWRCLGA